MILAESLEDLRSDSNIRLIEDVCPFTLYNEEVILESIYSGKNIVFSEESSERMKGEIEAYIKETTKEIERIKKEYPAKNKKYKLGVYLSLGVNLLAYCIGMAAPAIIPITLTIQLISLIVEIVSLIKKYSNDADTLNQVRKAKNRIKNLKERARKDDKLYDKLNDLYEDISNVEEDIKTQNYKDTVIG